MLRKASTSLGHVPMPLWSLPKLLNYPIAPTCDGSATFPLSLVTVCANLVKLVLLR